MYTNIFPLKSDKVITFFENLEKEYHFRASFGYVPDSHKFMSNTITGLNFNC